jgi:hypothetical protein
MSTRMHSNNIRSGSKRSPSALDHERDQPPGASLPNGASGRMLRRLLKRLVLVAHQLRFATDVLCLAASPGGPRVRRPVDPVECAR